MPSALWTFYDQELWRDVRAADRAGDLRRLAELLASAALFEQLVASLGDEPRAAEVQRGNRWLTRRVLELSLAADPRPPRSLRANDAFETK